MIALGSSRTLDVAEPVVEGLPTNQDLAANEPSERVTA
jgi:hypothetical protein